MIKLNDRSRWIGASDADKVVGNWGTKTWQDWWATVLGLYPNNHWNNRYTKAGTFYEHEILRSLGLPIIYDYQVRIPELSVRINYDGIVMPDKHIKEVKTYKGDKTFKMSKTYWRQAQMEMFGLDTDKLDIIAYAMDEENYDNYFLPIEEEKREIINVARDDDFIDNLLIPRLEILHDCIEKGKFPKEVS